MAVFGRNSITIIGGGLSGFAAAELLAERGCRVTVLECDATVGGLARSFPHNDSWIPEAYHHAMKPDHVTIEYLQKYGLETDLNWINN